MKPVTVMICMFSTALVASIATSGMWLAAAYAHADAPPVVVRYISAPPGAVMPRAALPPPASAIAAAIPPATVVPTSPVPARTSAPRTEADVAVHDDGPVSDGASAPSTASDADAPAASVPVAATEADAAPSASEPVAARSDDVVPVSNTVVEPAADSIYHETYVSYFGFDEIQARTVPWYGRHFHLDEDELLTICFIARAANVPFGPAISIYVGSCNGSIQQLLGYYHLSPQVFLIAPGAEFQCPANLLAPYEWQRRGAQEALWLSNRQFLDLLALKLAVDYLHCPADQVFKAPTRLPLRLLSGHPQVHAASAPVSFYQHHGAIHAAGMEDQREPSQQREPVAVIMGEDGVHRLMRGGVGETPAAAGPSSHLAHAPSVIANAPGTVVVGVGH